MKLTIELSDQDAADLRKLVDHMNANAAEASCSHGRLDLVKLATLLLEDAALAQRRPGSWEGANMATVLEAHGYQL